MWKRAILIGLLIGLIFIAVGITAQPQTARDEEIVQKLNQVLENQESMFQYLKFIKNKV